MRNRINAIAKSRAFYIMFSVIASIALWVYVDYMENEEIQRSVTNIPISFLNADFVTDRQLVITDYGKPTVTAEFYGRRSTVSLLNNDSVRAVVDLVQVNSAGLRSLAYTLVYNSNIDERSISMVTPDDDGYITVNVEDIYKKEVLIDPRYGGNIAAEGFKAEPVELSSSAVTVSGPRSVVERIESAVVDIRRENLTKTVTEEMGFAFMDAEGAEVPRDMLTLSPETVSVRIPINVVKDIPLEVRLIYGAGATADNVVCEITPSSLTLSGPAESLALNTLQLGTIDVTSFVSDYIVTRQIALPEGTQNLTGINEAIITISVKGLATKRLQTSNIQFINETEHYTSSLITSVMDVTLRGTEESLRNLTSDNLRVVADMTEYNDTSGVFSIPVRVYVDGAPGDVGAIGEYRITARITYTPPGTG